MLLKRGSGRLKLEANKELVSKLSYLGKRSEPRENGRARGRGKESLQRSLIHFHFRPGNPATPQSVKTVTANVPLIRKVTTACHVSLDSRGRVELFIYLFPSAPRGFAAPSRVLARLVSLAQIGELARRLLRPIPNRLAAHYGPGQRDGCHLILSFIMFPVAFHVGTRSYSVEFRYNVSRHASKCAAVGSKLLHVSHHALNNRRNAECTNSQPYLCRRIC